MSIASQVSKSFQAVFLAVLFLFVYSSAQAAPTAATKGLSDRELAIQRWFSSLSYLQDRRQNPWPEWHSDGKELGIGSLRYQIAFAGYGCAVMAAKTPAYHELVAKQLDDLCQRMIDLRTWQYVTVYWKYGDNPPDPCLYENVMYTGHLAQLMCLYELMTGDLRYSTEGWDFTWRDGRKTHYTLGKAVERMHDLSKASPNGGICCEPGLLFAVCNTHSAMAMVMYDLIHGTHYAEANKRWFDWMSKNFRQKIPGSREFLYTIYHQRSGMFAPVSDLGADGWALGWGYPWYPTTAFAREGWEYVQKHAQWEKPKPGQTYARGNPLVGCCAGGTMPMRNSFLPLAAVQVDGASSVRGQEILRWLEAECGKEVDTDADGHNDAYYYHSDNSLRIVATSNIAAALATDGESLRRFFNTKRTDILAEPTLAHVDYPNVCVRAAEFIKPTLCFTVFKGKPGFSGKTELVCEKISGNLKILRDGKPFKDFKKADSTVVLTTDVDRPHTFELTITP